MENREMLSIEKIWQIGYRSVKNLENVVGITCPYLRNENCRQVYKVPVIVLSDDRPIDMVGVAEIKIDPYSGEVLKKLTKEEIDSKVEELLSRKANT